MGKFVIKQSGNGYTFNLLSSNGKVVGTGGEIYNTLASCKKGIESVMYHARRAEIEDQTYENAYVKKHPKFEIYIDKAEKYRFRLKANNGEPILASQGYASKSGCNKGIESVRENIYNASIVEPGQ